jgi:sarcosine oxidase
VTAVDSGRLGRRLPHPAHPEISIAAGFSGHGYKFCSVIGEVMADLVQGERGRHDLGFFRLWRFAKSS